MTIRVVTIYDYRGKAVGYLQQKGHGAIRGYAINGNEAEYISRSDFPLMAAVLLLSAVYQRRAGEMAIIRDGVGGWTWPPAFYGPWYENWAKNRRNADLAASHSERAMP